MTYTKTTFADGSGGGTSITAAELNKIGTGIETTSTDIATNTAAIALNAPLASPTFTGTPAAPTATGGTNTTQVATTAFTTAAVAAEATARSAADTTLTTNVATNATAIASEATTRASADTTLTTAVAGKAATVHTHAESDVTNLVADLALKAPLASPTFTGTPAAPTAGAGTNTTQVATTAFATTADALLLPLAGGTLTGNLIFSADNTKDIGASGATRPRTVYAGTSFITPKQYIGTPGAFFGLVADCSASSVSDSNLACLGVNTKLAWVSNTDASSPGGKDVALSRNAAGVLEVNTGTSGTYATTVAKTIQSAPSSANGQSVGLTCLTELTTIAAAATTDTAIQIPAGAIVLAVSVRNTVAVTCTSTYTVGDSGNASRYSTAAVSKAVNSTDAGTKAGAYYNASAVSVRITPDTTPSDATGRVRITVFYFLSTAPTS